MHAAEADAWLALGLASVLNSLPLSAQLATVSGSLWSRVLQVLIAAYFWRFAHRQLGTGVPLMCD